MLFFSLFASQSAILSFNLSVPVSVNCWPGDYSNSRQQSYKQTKLAWIFFSHCQPAPARIIYNRQQAWIFCLRK
jgi:hypothetical protein